MVILAETPVKQINRVQVVVAVRVLSITMRAQCNREAVVMVIIGHTLDNILEQVEGVVVDSELQVGIVTVTHLVLNIVIQVTGVIKALGMAVTRVGVIMVKTVSVQVVAGRVHL
jgi:hypothetical protein